MIHDSRFTIRDFTAASLPCAIVESPEINHESHRRSSVKDAKTLALGSVESYLINIYPKTLTLCILDSRFSTAHHNRALQLGVYFSLRSAVRRFVSIRCGGRNSLNKAIVHVAQLRLKTTSSNNHMLSYMFACEPLSCSSLTRHKHGPADHSTINTQSQSRYGANCCRG